MVYLQNNFFFVLSSKGLFVIELVIRKRIWKGTDFRPLSRISIRATVNARYLDLFLLVPWAFQPLVGKNTLDNSTIAVISTFQYLHLVLPVPWHILSRYLSLFCTFFILNVQKVQTNLKSGSSHIQIFKFTVMHLVLFLFD